MAIWGNLAAFYVINWIFSALPSSGMYTIMFRLCRQPSYWIAIFVSSLLTFASDEVLHYQFPLTFYFHQGCIQDFVVFYFCKFFKIGNNIKKNYFVISSKTTKI